MQRERAIIQGFSKLSREQKLIEISQYVSDREQFIKAANSHLHTDESFQRKYQEFSENTLSNFYLPYGIAPNFLINGKIYHVPMVIEESSVVAAASWSAKFWLDKGGFKCEVVNTIKCGQVHFEWYGPENKLITFFNKEKGELLDDLTPLTSRMQERGGGILDITLRSLPEVFSGYHQLELSFDTIDSMGANFINSCLEELAANLRNKIEKNIDFTPEERKCKILMSILSNYTPDCRVLCRVSVEIKKLDNIFAGMSGNDFAEKFIKALQIAKLDINRAVTHNKGIYNGIDAVVLATGNDFRAVEACGHAYASRNGKYGSLSKAWIKNGELVFELETAMALGTVGGLTLLHPMAAYTLEILGWPSVTELMMIASAVGLANNFSAIRSLITVGIQSGHMKMHLSNILNYLNVSDVEKDEAIKHFEGKNISFAEVSNFINSLREN